MPSPLLTAPALAAASTPLPAATSAASALSIYWRGLYVCLVRHGAYAELRALTDSKRARLQIYSLALHVRLWHRAHYRSGTFQKDLQKNLCNVAVPKTGVPLSLLCYSRALAALFLAALYPLLCAVGSRVGDGVRVRVRVGVRLVGPSRAPARTRTPTRTRRPRARAA